MDDAPETVTDAVATLIAEGYTADFGTAAEADGTVVCPVCGSIHAFTSGIVERTFRFEGPSDPGDEAIVLGLRCTNCGALGTLVSAYGPGADPDTFSRLEHRRPG
jgi:hypothetical protein